MKDINILIVGVGGQGVILASDAIAEIGDQPQDNKVVEQNFRNEAKPKESIEEFRKRVFNA